ncbi:MAG TPA: DUF3500 domain-containing protein [Streptosporangiaceae bacterium]|nr:DUF3500 domain-containing protein [Streptosporangiaceae bacterium]
MSRGDDIGGRMASAADALIAELTGDKRAAVLLAFDGAERTGWSYLPGSRPGVVLLDLTVAARKAAHRLLATALSRPAFAQAVTIMALEEVLDIDEGGGLGRHSDDYRVAVFGRPGADAWAWRFEGHHLSVTATISGADVVVAPIFLGVNPARVEHGGGVVTAPLAPEEDLARALIAEMGPGPRADAIIASGAPADIVTRTAVEVPGELAPRGVSAARLGPGAREMLDRLVRLYLGRLAPDLAAPHLARLDAAGAADVAFAWAGGLRPGEGHYYRIQAPRLLIEYDNTQRAANHAHTVLRRPGEDFGAALLPAHLTAEG